MGKLRKGDREVEQELYVVENLRKQLLERPAVEALELVVRVEAVDGDRRSPIDQFSKLFQGLVKLEGEYSIKLQEGAKPFALTVPHQVAIPLMKQVKDESERMEQLGVIDQVSKQTEWCAGMVLPKANNKVRICVDLARLNENVCQERHNASCTVGDFAEHLGLFYKGDVVR